jgi:hypothetical protein
LQILILPCLSPQRWLRRDTEVVSCLEPGLGVASSREGVAGSSNTKVHFPSQITYREMHRTIRRCQNIELKYRPCFVKEIFASSSKKRTHKQYMKTRILLITFIAGGWKIAAPQPINKSPVRAREERETKLRRACLFISVLHWASCCVC